MKQIHEPSARNDRDLRFTGGERPKLRRVLLPVLWSALVVAVAAAAAGWLGIKASIISEQLQSASQMVTQLKGDVLLDDAPAAASTVDQMMVHTKMAKDAASDPIWVMAGALPWVGPNFQAVSEVARTADDVANLGAAPLARVFRSLDWKSLMPNSGEVQLGEFAEAAPTIRAAAHAVHQSSDRLNEVDAEGLIPEIARPLVETRDELAAMRTGLDAAANLASLLPDMMGESSPRHYLLMIQNNSEARASGGIPGALAVLQVDKGRMTLGTQASAGSLGVMSPPFAVDAAQEEIYSVRLGKYMQDVNLTPDFPTAASTAQAMWERKTGQRVDGVISIDPVALGYILDATGTVTIKQPEIVALAAAGLPTELTEKNVVQTLLSDVYSKIERPDLQDAYFAGVAQEIFAALSDGKRNAEGLIEGLTRGTSEGRVLVWSGLPAEQSIIAKYALSGSIAGPSVAPAQFGVYFNDGTGAKMDYHIKRTVQLVKECSQNGYEQTTVRISSTNTASADAAASLPAYVTGGGAFGVPAGSVQTNLVAYGPVQANIETAKVDGQRTSFAPYVHSNRPVGVLAVRLAPGERKTVDFTFGKIVQHTEPKVFVTPTVQPVNDVILPASISSCG